MWALIKIRAAAKVDITMNDGKLHFKSENISDFEGDMSFYKGNTFVVK